VISLAAILASTRQRLPGIIVVRMILNVLINGAIGAIPFLGDIFSFWFKSNVRNYRLVVNYSGKGGPVERHHYIMAGAAFGVLLLAIGLLVLTFSMMFGLIMRTWSTIFPK
jgi:hypothetical protein